jgi:hypothetical protein
MRRYENRRGFVGSFGRGAGMPSQGVNRRAAASRRGHRGRKRWSRGPALVVASLLLVAVGAPLQAEARPSPSRHAVTVDGRRVSRGQRPETRSAERSRRDARLRDMAWREAAGGYLPLDRVLSAVWSLFTGRHREPERTRPILRVPSPYAWYPTREDSLILASLGRDLARLTVRLAERNPSSSPLLTCASLFPLRRAGGLDGGPVERLLSGSFPGETPSLLAQGSRSPAKIGPALRSLLGPEGLAAARTALAWSHSAPVDSAGPSRLAPAPSRDGTDLVASVEREDPAVVTPARSTGEARGEESVSEPAR